MSVTTQTAMAAGSPGKPAPAISSPPPRAGDRDAAPPDYFGIGNIVYGWNPERELTKQPENGAVPSRPPAATTDKGDESTKPSAGEGDAITGEDGVNAALPPSRPAPPPPAEQGAAAETAAAAEDAPTQTPGKAEAAPGDHGAISP